MRVLLCTCSGAVPDEKEPPPPPARPSGGSLISQFTRSEFTRQFTRSFASGATPLLSSAGTGSSRPASDVSVSKSGLQPPPPPPPPSPFAIIWGRGSFRLDCSCRFSSPRRLKSLFNHEAKHPLGAPCWDIKDASTQSRVFPNYNH